MLTRFVGFLACLIVLGCAASDGVQQRGAQMLLHEDFVIGSDSAAEYALTTVTDLVRDKTGNLLVAQPMDQSVWTYNAAGEFQFKIGRAGAGPGEFSMPAYLGFWGGSLWVCDTGLSRLTMFTNGRPDSLITPRIELDLIRFVPTRLLKDGSVFSKPSVYLNLVSSGQVTALPLLRLAGAQLDTITVLPLAHTWWVAVNEHHPDAGEGYSPQPLADDPLFAVSPDGDEIVLVDRSAATPSNRTMAVTRYSYTGQLIDSTMLAYAPLPLPRDRVSALVTKRAATHASRMFATAADAARSLRKTLYVPDHLPPATHVVLAPDGRVWLRREDTDTPTVTWWVLDTRNRLEWEFSAPRDLTLFFADKHSAAGVILDELEVPHIAVYTLVPQSR